MALIIRTDAIDCVNEGRDIPAFLTDDDGVRIIHIGYHSTDGWRGYYEAKGQDVMAVFTPTSNVFSTSFDVFVK